MCSMCLCGSKKNNHIDTIENIESHIGKNYVFYVVQENNIKNIKMTQKGIDKLSYDIIGFAIEVHKELGPGLLESVYEKCLIHLLKRNGYHIQSQ